MLSESGSDLNYVFRQSLLRELIYNTLSFARRRELHAQVAAHLEAEFEDEVTQPVELLAFHHQAAAQWLPATRYHLRSAARARRRYAYTQANDFYSRALESLAKIPRDQAEAIASLRSQVREGQGDLALLTRRLCDRRGRLPGGSLNSLRARSREL